MSERENLQKELEKKDAEMLRQQERAASSNDRLHGYDKTDADSFPASDPPSPMTSVVPGADAGTDEG
ncbi:MAG TPA: hypothetical protein VFN49_03295 [Candidatus Aquilonibacter sp.]|nr:hypothetical protein [Candidatus Aquilonibacter sp.]